MRKKTGPDVDIDHIFAEGTLIDHAMCQAAREAAEAHRRAGVPMVFWENGRVVRVPAEEVLSLPDGGRPRGPATRESEPAIRQRTRPAARYNPAKRRRKPAEAPMTLATDPNATSIAPVPQDAEPTWDIAHLFPAQGTWSEQEYLELRGNRLVEFSHGIVEVLTMPTMDHQLIVAYLHAALTAFISAAKLGTALFAPFRIRLWDGKFRQPDVMFMRAEHAPRMGKEFWDGADLVMEVVNEDDRRRDVETKRFEYARARIPEYWVVDPQKQRVTVLKLEGQRYAVHGEFGPGQKAASALLGGFEVGVAEVFAAAET